jgi:hypothetical protein
MRTKVKLGQVQVESVSFVGTKVADEESGAVRSSVAPPKGGRVRVSRESLQIDEELRVETHSSFD